MNTVGSETDEQRAYWTAWGEREAERINNGLYWAHAHSTGIWWQWQTGAVPADMTRIEVDVLCQK
ncbi:MAG: hypothetical protein Q8R28_05780 [Dehalococcoidia bacterium]|nr:hypothetical protein [Dehalococcoidia bacterium]